MKQIFQSTKRVGVWIFIFTLFASLSTVLFSYTKYNIAEDIAKH